MIVHLLTLLAALSAAPEDEHRFTFLDVEAIDGRAVVRYRPVELGPQSVRPVGWDEPPPPDARFGLLRVGRSPASGLAVAWSPGGSILWVDADGDGRLARSERHTLEAGKPMAIEARIAVASEPGAEAKGERRTIVFRTGLLGTGPRYTVRGCMAGMLAMGEARPRVMLTDGNADGCFDAAGADRAWVDLDGDGRLDPATEWFPLGLPIRVGADTYTIASDPAARSVSAHRRDGRLGRLVLGLRGTDGAEAGSVRRLSVSLVSQFGELVAVEALGRPHDVPVGRYRLDAFQLELAGPDGRTWSYAFTGGRTYAIDVEPGRTATARLLDGLAFEVAVETRGPVRPGDEIDVTPNLRLGSGLYLTDCGTRAADASYGTGRTAEIRLTSPSGEPLDRAHSGFA